MVIVMGTVRVDPDAIGIGWVAAREVDEQGLTWAVRHSGLRALAALGTAFDLVLLDGKHNYLRDTPHTAIATIKADQKMVPVAAASVIAKVARDNYLSRLGRHYHQYGFASHKGYGTAEHQRALQQYGLTPHHRRSFDDRVHRSRPALRRYRRWRDDAVRRRTPSHAPRVGGAGV